MKAKILIIVVVSFMLIGLACDLSRKASHYIAQHVHQITHNEAH